MKIKTLIGTIALAASTCFGATDAELKAMLDAKDYNGFAVKATMKQVKTLLTAENANYVIKSCISSNKIWNAVIICESKLVDWQTPIDLFIEKNDPKNACFMANRSKDDAMRIYTWEKIMVMSNASSRDVITYIGNSYNVKIANLELAKQTANKILKECPIYYTHYVFGGVYANQLKMLSDEYKAWMIDCIKNVNEKTCNLNGWRSLIYFDRYILKTGFSQSSMYYFSNIWNITGNEHFTKYIIAEIWNTEYREMAFESIIKSLTNSKAAYKLIALKADKRLNNKETTKRLYPVIAKDIHLGLDAAKYLNDVDKVIDILLVAKEELSAEELNSVIPMINALDADYRKDDIVKALRNINARYTLKLYDDRETWEPVLSKIRALIDVRQM